MRNLASSSTAPPPADAACSNEPHAASARTGGGSGQAPVGVQARIVGVVRRDAPALERPAAEREGAGVAQKRRHEAGGGVAIARIEIEPAGVEQRLVVAFEIGQFAVEVGAAP